MRRLLFCLHFAFCILHFGTPAAAQSPAAPLVTEVRVEQENRPITDESITSLIETPVGKPLAIRDVRESIAHLSSLDRFDDVLVYREDLPGGGVRVRYVLVPSHPVDKVEFRGMLGLPEDDVRRVVRDRFGVAPPARRADAVTAALKETYSQRGFPEANVMVAIEPTHNPDRATMVLNIQAGPRVAIARVIVDQEDETPANVVVGAPDVRVGQPYDAERIDKELERYATTMRERGYLEARASHTADFTPQGADVTLQVFRGPRVTIAFTGDPIPAAERDKLVPIRTEASVNQDILEDSQNAILNYLHARGYRDATVEYTPTEKSGELTLTFHVLRGPRYTVENLTVSGNTSVPPMELLAALRLKKGEPFVQSTLDAGIQSVRNIYRNLGFTKADVRPMVNVLPNTESKDVERRVDVPVTIIEGQRTIVRSISMKGNAAIPEADLRVLLTSAPDKPYSEVDLVADRDRVELEYRNHGFQNVIVTPGVALAENDTRADLTFSITEGPQIFVDHVIINGNKRTSRQTIEREIVLKPGEPLSYAGRIESQQRLTALGLFRRVRITDIQHGGNPRRDLLVTVDEAPPNTHSYGGGAEFGSFLHSAADGTAEERLEFIPRGSFEIGRRNMGGKNRSIDLFTRVALRTRGGIVNDEILNGQANDVGFNEYRIFTTYREPRIFNTRADLLLSASLEQARRSSFNFARRQAQAEAGLRLNPTYSLTGSYSFGQTRLFDEAFSPDEAPLIDRLFPQVRISSISTTLIRGRQDLVDPANTTFSTITGEMALRAIGSEVGFIKTYMEAFAYPQLPLSNHTVLALGARLGLARGFQRFLEGETVADIPASERFFSGGDTTVRGFSLDRLGSAGTITPSGFPTGGNAVVIFNAELRVGVIPSLEAVTFVDVGNVYAKVNQLNLTDMRPSVGIGARIKLPLLNAPIRVDLGFNLDPTELVTGKLERRTVLHVSLGQAF